MFPPVKNQWHVADNDNFRLANCANTIDDVPDSDYLKIEMESLIQRLFLAQQRLWADNRFSILCVFQAMDAAGKDSTIRSVFTGVNPAGVRVTSFKKPSSRELEQDFLWRTSAQNPTAGTIGVFNRSYYEEVLVVKVHPELLKYQHLVHGAIDDDFWEARYESIRNMERHLANNGTMVLKFFLNVSKKEQKKRFLKRLEDEEKNWKFTKADLRERGYWDDYMAAYETAIRRTSMPHAPWYVIPADDKKNMRWAVAQTVLHSLESLPLEVPNPAGEDAEVWQAYIDALKAESD